MSSQITCVTRGSANEMELRLIGKSVPEAGIVVAHITLCLRFAVSLLFQHSEVRFCGFVAAVWSSTCIVVAPSWLASVPVLNLRWSSPNYKRLSDEARDMLLQEGKQYYIDTLDRRG